MLPAWDAATPIWDKTAYHAAPPASYRPGAFWQRELPPIRSILATFGREPGIIVIDGYVWLDGGTRPGLGAHLFDSLGQTTPVVGIAKTRFRGDTWSIPVVRGASRRPLLVTAAGMDAASAAAAVLGMHGAHRLPTAVSRVDRAARARLSAGK